MTMARGIARQNEFAIRLALGARPSRVAAECAIEGVTIATIGTAIGFAMAVAFHRVILTTVPLTFGNRFSRVSSLAVEPSLGGSVIVFAALLAGTAGLLIALPPAIHAIRSRSIISTGDNCHTQSRSASIVFRYIVIVPQIALSVALLICATAFVATVMADLFVDVGYDAANLVVVDFDTNGTTDAAALKEAMNERRTMSERVVARLKDASGVVNVALTDGFRFGPFTASRTSLIAKSDVDRHLLNHRSVSRVGVSDDYFATIGTRLLRGRVFNVSEQSMDPGVAVVCEAVAQMFWPGQDPLGQLIAFQTPDGKMAPRWLEVIGVVQQTRPPLMLFRRC
jgi:hypothetical protein